MTTMQAAVFVTLLFIALAIPFIVRSIVWSRFINQMKKGNAQKALSILQSKSYKLLFSEYDQNWNILRVYISLGDLSGPFPYLYNCLLREGKSSKNILCLKATKICRAGANFDI